MPGHAGILFDTISLHTLTDKNSATRRGALGVAKTRERPGRESKDQAVKPDGALAVHLCPGFHHSLCYASTRFNLGGGLWIQIIVIAEGGASGFSAAGSPCRGSRQGPISSSCLMSVDFAGVLHKQGNATVWVQGGSWAMCVVCIEEVGQGVFRRECACTRPLPLFFFFGPCRAAAAEHVVP